MSHRYHSLFLYVDYSNSPLYLCHSIVIDQNVHTRHDKNSVQWCTIKHKNTNKKNKTKNKNTKTPKNKIRIWLLKKIIVSLQTMNGLNGTVFYFVSSSVISENTKHLDICSLQSITYCIGVLARCDIDVNWCNQKNNKQFQHAVIRQNCHLM